MEEDIKILEDYIKLIKKGYCLDCNELCNIYTAPAFPSGVVALSLENLIKGYRELEEENKQLKASHIMTHNKASIEEKAKLFDVIDNSIDTYLEQAKPHWEQIMGKEKMTIEEAEIIIDDMYQDRNKIIATKNDKGVTIHLDRLDDVKFTNLEFASVRALREIQSLRRKLESSIPKSKIKEKIKELKQWLDNGKHARYGLNAYELEAQKEVLQELMEDK